MIIICGMQPVFWLSFKKRVPLRRRRSAAGGETHAQAAADKYSTPVAGSAGGATAPAADGGGARGGDEDAVDAAVRYSLLLQFDHTTCTQGYCVLLI
jgi:hypothetical protein